MDQQAVEEHSIPRHALNLKPHKTACTARVIIGIITTNNNDIIIINWYTFNAFEFYLARARNV